ncbi:MAG: hypothetical protein AAF846_29575 [Chloroflexota bacterium]
MTVTFNPTRSQITYTAVVQYVESAIFNLDNQQKIQLIPDGYFQPQYSPDGSLLGVMTGVAGYGTDKFILIDTTDGERIVELNVYPSTFAFSNDGDLLFIGLFDTTAPNVDESTGIIHIYRTQDLIDSDAPEPTTILYMERPPHDIVISPDDRFIATTNDNENYQLQIWGVALQT